MELKLERPSFAMVEGVVGGLHTLVPKGDKELTGMEDSSSCFEDGVVLLFRHPILVWSECHN